MRLNSIKLQGITRFIVSEPVEIDFDSLGPGLVALVGPNGAGKSTLLEAPAAALYKSLPTRPGSLYDHAHGKDAFIEAVFSNEQHELKARIQIDAEQRKSEFYLFEDGTSLTTGRAAEFDLEVIQRFGSRELFLASVLAAQNKCGDFLRMMKRERKGLFVELLGLYWLQALSEKAKERRVDSEQGLRVAKAILENAEKELTALPELEKQLSVDVAKAEEAALCLDKARIDETVASTMLERARAAGEQLRVHEAAFQAAERETKMAQTALNEAEALPNKIEAQIRQRLAALDSQDPELLVQRAHERHGAGKQACSDRQERIEVLIAREPEVEDARAQVIELETEVAALEESERKLDELSAQGTVAEGKLAHAERWLAHAVKMRVSERERLEHQAELLNQVPCTDDTFGDLASECPLLSEARDAKAGLLKSLAAGNTPDTTEVDASRMNLETIRACAQEASLTCDPLRLKEIKDDALPAARATASEAHAIERAKRDMESIKVELAQLAQELKRDLQEAFSSRERIAKERKAFAADRFLNLQEAAAKETKARQTLEGAMARRAEAEGALREAEALHQGLQVSTCQQQYSEAEMARKRAERELREADQQLAGISTRVDQLQERARSLHSYRDATLLAETEVGDWSLLERALGRDGIQALEIDAAGPEVARLTNELLEACYGSRFSISFETLREKKSARGEYSEAFDIIVYDQGRPRAVEALSGGERVIIGEALGLGLAVFNARKSGIQWQTIFRDETSGALDADSAAQYVLMLRRALKLGGFEQCVFVAHQPAVFEAADFQIFVTDGKVSIGEGIRNA